MTNPTGRRSPEPYYIQLETLSKKNAELVSTNAALVQSNTAQDALIAAQAAQIATLQQTLASGGGGGSGVPNYPGGSNNRAVRLRLTITPPVYVDITEADQRPTDAIRGSDGLLYGQGSLVPMTGLMPNTKYRRANSTGGAPNMVPVEATPPQPSETFTLEYLGITNAAGNLKFEPGPALYIPAAAPTVPPGVKAIYKFLQVNEANKLYDTSGQIAAPATIDTTKASFSPAGLTIIAETNITVPVAIPDGFMTVYFAGKQTDLLTNHSILGTIDSFGDPHMHWTLTTTGTQLFRPANNVVNPDFTAAGAAAPAGVQRIFCLVVTPTEAKLYDSENALLGTIALTVAMRAFTSLWLGRRRNTGNAFIGTLQYLGIYNTPTAHTTQERANGLALAKAAVAGRP